MTLRFFVMTFRRASVLTVSLVAALWAASCAPSAPPAPADAITPTTPPATALPLTQAPSEPVTEVQPVATSRGPDLHATDPATVSLASGDLQLVEFFRFT